MADEEPYQKCLKAPRWKILLAWLFVVAPTALYDIKQSRLMLRDVIKGHDERESKERRDRLISRHLH